MRTCSAPQAGFTLMEVLVAITITAVIGLGVWQVISGIILSRDRVDVVANEFESVQRAFLLLERDVHQIVDRPIRNIYGDFEPALSSRDEAFALTLTRQGWRNPLGRKRSELQRSAYELTGEELHRRYWITVDRGQEEESQNQKLLEDVTEFDVRFMDQERNWVDDWPPEDDGGGNSNPGMGQIQALPLGIELTLTHRRFGELVRVFSMPDFDRASAQGEVMQANQPPPETGDEEPPEEEEAQQQ